MTSSESSNEGQKVVSERTLREFACLWLFLFGGFAVHSALKLGNVGKTWILAAIGLLVGAWGLLKPGAIRPLFSGLIVITAPIGWVMSRALLSLAFYGIIAPVGIFFRLVGRDVLARKRPANQSSYWSEKEMPSDVRRYFRES